MSARKPHQNRIDPVLLIRLYSVLEILQERDPDPLRADFLTKLRVIRNKIASGDDHDAEWAKLRIQLPDLTTYIEELEATTLGRRTAQDLRSITSPAAIAQVITHSAANLQTAAGTDKQEPAWTVPPAGDAVVAAAARGDRTAVEHLMRHLRPVVLRYCRFRVAQKHDADNLTQEILINVITALPNYRDQGRPFLAFVYSIAAHKVATTHRQQVSTEISTCPKPFTTPVDLAPQIATLLRALPDKQREIVILRVVVGLSADETAEAVGSTPGAVRVAQHRALSRLRKELAKNNRNAKKTPTDE